MEQLSADEISEKVEAEFPRRMSSILRKKLAYRYHELPQCKGKPLILMIAPFFEAGSVFYTDEALIDSLYRNKAITKAFFLEVNAASINCCSLLQRFHRSTLFSLGDSAGRQTRNDRYSERHLL